MDGRGHAATFGEIMVRLSAPDGVRLAHARSLELTYGGGEANVAASLAGYGVPARFISRVPANDLGAGAIGLLRGLGVDTSGISVEPGRLGTYYLETGAAQRPSRVVYDRAGSCIAVAGADSYDWPALLAGASWYHSTGITPALSAAAAAAAIAAARAA
ncbi:MAG: PfkB family carbohydrate kinase, partial [Chloroflexota bacterium]